MSININLMYLHISPSRLISDVQKDFNKAFPFLKLEFFNNRTFSRANFSVSQIIPSNKEIGDSQPGIPVVDLEIAEDMKVIELEQLFRDKFKLAVQVFRKSGKLWLETTMTDNWTLTQQNNHGREISTESNMKDDIDDFDLTRDADH